MSCQEATILPRFSHVLSVVLLLFYVWATAGVMLFGGQLSHVGDAAAPSLANFNSLLGAAATLFQLLVGSNWYEVMFEVRDKVGTLSVPYFVSWVVLCTVLVANLVVGIIVSAYRMVSELRQERAAGERYLTEHDVANAFASHGQGRDQISDLVSIDVAGLEKGEELVLEHDGPAAL